MIELPSQPLDQEWEKAAAKDLIEILHWLAHGSFVSADDLCERLRQCEEAIRSIYGNPINYRERHAEWRERLAAFERENIKPKVIKLISCEPDEPDPSDPNYGDNAHQ